MGRGRGPKNRQSTSQAVSRSIKTDQRGKNQKQPIDNPKIRVLTRPGGSFGLRSGLTTTTPFVVDPDLPLKESLKAQKAKKVKARNKPENPFIEPDSLAKSIETALAGERHHIDHSTSQELASEEASILSQDPDLEQNFYRFWGYLPPLDEEAAAVMDAIIANPEMAEQSKRISTNSADFPIGLTYRNVFFTESLTSDLQVEYIEHLVPRISNTETDGEKNLYGQLWTFDQAKCNEGSNEALFQRTLMMSLIARHSFIYERTEIDRHCLDFSVEEIWTCPPMPTRAYTKRTNFLTQPKPDLAVCFRRQALISNMLWNNMPRSTKRLACYENIDEIRGTRVFHFFTIEAKKANISSNDTVGKRQSLNNASQALHNMFEFFRDAGQQHEDIFFAKVLFFSVVASTEGLTIRIHRATKEPADEFGEGHVTPGYPLRFEYEVFGRIQKDYNFKRSTVLEMFERILIAYGAEVLQPLISDAARALMQKLSNDVQGMELREKNGFYRYGQTVITPKSRKQTPAPSIVSATPTQNQAAIPPQRLNAGGKRLREPSEDTMPARNTRSRKS